MTAEDISKEFKEHSVAEFFKKNMQMLGLTGKIKALTTIVHEYMSNSLDACEEAHILPDIEVQINEIGNEQYEVIVKDNGPGLTEETVGKAFGKLLAGTKFHRMIQMRGQQGIGSSGCTMLSQMTTGKPTQVITGTSKGPPISVEVTIDPKNNAPKVDNLVILKKEFKGTAVKAKFKGVKFVNSESSPLEYLRRTAIANPHAKITFIDPAGTKTVFDRTSKQIPARPTEIQPHPRGVSVDDVMTLSKTTKSKKIASFLREEFDRVGDKAIEEITKHVSFDLNKDPHQLQWDEAEEIVAQFKKIEFLAPRTDGLRPIGEERVQKSLKSIVEPEFLEVATRKPQVYAGGFPFQIEVALAYGGNAGRMSTDKDEEGQSVRKIEIMRFANNVPLLFDTGGCAITKAVQSVDWKRYGMRDIENAPLTIFVNLISVHVPYTSAGKQALSDEEAIMEELRLSLMEVGRKMFRYIGFRKREEEKQKKRKLFYKYATEVAIGLAELTGKKKEEIEAKLHDIVLRHLKLEEAQEAKQQQKGSELSEEEVEKEYQKRVQKEEKEKAKKKKKLTVQEE
ncbi:MAG: DNA topoisomerase VI subunit B [Candidatus Diapherotrites archaeon]|nr:DNA topoisomerase VI subunit B [Candidatus Diapherotrites archaeon]